MKFRNEYKHQINLADYYGLRTRISAIAQHDSYALEDGKYFIKSLYFDNYLDKALREKVDGVNKREKFRIRYYNDDLSLSEIAENEDKSRNAIHKSIKSVCSKLIEYEEILGLYKKEIKLREIIDKIEDKEIRKELEGLL